MFAASTPEHGAPNEMIAEVEQKHREIIDLCKQYEVIRLGLFGSAARGDFDPETSDLDFLVLFDRRDNPDYTTRYFGLVDDSGSTLRARGRSGDRISGAITLVSRSRRAQSGDDLRATTRSQRRVSESRGPRRYQSLLFTFHAVQQMAERGITSSQVERALEEGRKRPGRDETIVSELVGDDGKTLRVIFAEMNDGESRIARIITAIRIGKRR